MNRARLELSPGVVLDARRAVFLEAERLLAIADLHLGYAWAHRHRGQLLPVSVPDDTAERLEVLISEYHPEAVALLGDIVHDAVPLPEFRTHLREFLTRLEQLVRVHLIAGNHDRALARVIDQPLLRDLQTGPHRLLHGDGHSPESALAILDQVANSNGLLIIGHEHPAIGISDRVAHRVRVPCFLSAPRLLVLPAFSAWAAGCEIRRGEFLSPFPELAAAEKAIAILAGKLLPVRMNR